MTEEIGAYLATTCETEPLADEETRRLVRVTRTGPPEQRLEARNRLIEANMRLVASRAKRFRYAGIPYRDLMQVGVFGMIRAIELYDKQKARLSTYMTMWIDAEMQRYIDRWSTTIRQPVGRRRDLLAVKRARRRLSQELGREPTPHELEEETGVSTANIAILTNTERVKSLDAPMREDRGGESRGAFIPDNTLDIEDEAAVAALWEAIGESVARLGELCDERAPKIIREHFVLGRSYTDIANDLGITRQRVQQIKDASVALLRYLCHDDGLAETWQTCDCRLHNRAADFVIELGT